MTRRRPGDVEDDPENSIVMSDVSMDQVSVNTNNNEDGKTEVSGNFSVMMLENREFHNSFNVQ